MGRHQLDSKRESSGIEARPDLRPVESEDVRFDIRIVPIPDLPAEHAL
jgi:hypothetical protein